MTTEQRAKRARAILEDVLFTDAIAAIRERQLTAFENSTPEETGVREQAHHMLRAINLLTGELRSAIDDEAIKRGRHRGRRD